MILVYIPTAECYMQSQHNFAVCVACVSNPYILGTIYKHFLLYDPKLDMTSSVKT